MTIAKDAAVSYTHLDKLYIGITNPDGAHTRDTVHDENRGTKAGNPLTYFERCEMIRGAMEEFNVPAKEYDFIPFPISMPEYIAQYTPKEAVYYVGMSDACLLYTYRCV